MSQNEEQKVTSNKQEQEQESFQRPLSPDMPNKLTGPSNYEEVPPPPPPPLTLAAPPPLTLAAAVAALT